MRDVKRSVTEGEGKFGVEDLLGRVGCSVYLVYWAPHHPPTPHPSPAPQPGAHTYAQPA